MKPIHKEILDKLTKLCDKNPAQRFGQILFNHTKIGTPSTFDGLVVDPFNYQDEDFLNSIEDIEKKEVE